MPRSQSKKQRKSAGSTANAQSDSRNWLERGRKLLEEGDAKGAIACAHSGLEELGDDYFELGGDVEDDTGQKLLAAEALIERGREEDGARLMLRMLESRLGMYADLHAGK
jgi:hypothetical protein